MKYIMVQQGQWDAAMGSPGSPITFEATKTGMVLVVAQATVKPTELEETIGVRFRVFHGTTELKTASNFVRLQFPNHGAVPVTYLALSELTEGETYHVAIDADPATPGQMSPEDYFSVSVVELEHAPMQRA